MSLGVLNIITKSFLGYYSKFLYLIKLLINMNKYIYKVLVILFFIIFKSSTGQSIESKMASQEQLFESSYLLPVKLKYSRKQLRKETSDSVYMASQLSYKLKKNDWKTINIKIRARGNFRRKTCYFLPLKLKISKTNAKETIFEGQKTLKAVLPCLNEYSRDDNVIKEYIIYKMYEKVTPYYFNTRLLDIEYDDVRNKKVKTHQLKGFFIEDDSKAAKRLNGKIIKRIFMPQSFDDLSAIRNAMFQYMVGNTDFSATNSHNSKVIYVDKKVVPISYDFDMAGFVNTSYSLVAKTKRGELPIENVTERYYMGYKRDYKLFEQIRVEFLNNKTVILKVIDEHKLYFDSKRSYDVAKAYINNFFKTISDKSLFKSRIYNVALKMK